jgi:nucleoside-diphosphate-sugar epimerase
MDVYFTFMGTTLPVVGDEAPLVNRPFKFMQTFFNSIKNDVDKGKIGIIGDGNVKHSYITVDNTAKFIVKAIEEPDLFNKTIPLGGPEALSALEIKAVFEKVLGKPLNIKKTPAYVMKIMGNLLAPFNPAASNIMKLNYLSAVEPSTIDVSALAEKLGIKLTTAEEFLEEKLAMTERENTLLKV